MVTAKQEYLDREADAWFERNKSAMEKKEVSIGTKFFADFFQRTLDSQNKQKKVLEIGCSFGYNLAFLSKLFPNIINTGLEPSLKAVEYGSKKYAELIIQDRLHLFRGTADALPFNDLSFDVILIGFCLYQADRNLLSKIVSEIDRCLRYESFLVITDFDVLFNVKKINKHNASTPTFKQNYAKLFERLGYSLVEKTTYNADSLEKRVFPTEMDNRISTQILYKEKIEDVYQ